MADERKGLLEHFATVAGVEEERARLFLEMTNWNLDLALTNFFESNEDSDTEVVAHPRDPTPPRGTDHSARHGVPAVAGSAAQGRKGAARPTAPSSKHGTEEMEPEGGGGAASAGGQRVAPFLGRAYRLGDPLTQSEVIEGPQVQQKRQVDVAMKFWRNGFSLNDGPLREFNTPQNVEFVNAIRRNEVPRELIEQARGGEVNLSLEDHRNEDYGAPRKVVQIKRVQPPNKLIQRNQQQPAQLVMDGDGPIVRSTDMKQNFIHIIKEYLPSLVERLMFYCRVSEAGEADSGYEGSDSDIDELKKNLTEQLRILHLATKRLLQIHNNGQIMEEKSDDTDLTWSTQELRRLTIEAIELRCRFMAMLSIPDAKEDINHRNFLDEIRLILSNDVFFDHRLHEPFLEREDVSPYDSPIRDTWELIKVVCNELRHVIDYAKDMRKWMSTYVDTDGHDVTPSETQSQQHVRVEACKLLDQLSELCNRKLAGQILFLIERSRLSAIASKKPSFSRSHRMEELNAFELLMAIKWRKHANCMIKMCEFFLEFVERHIRVLEK